MRRGERKLYRELGEAATAVAESSDYAQEYLAKGRLIEADKALRAWARTVLFPTTPHRPTRSEQSLEGAAVNGLTPVGQEDEL